MKKLAFLSAVAVSTLSILSSQGLAKNVCAELFDQSQVGDAQSRVDGATGALETYRKIKSEKSELSQKDQTDLARALEGMRTRLDSDVTRLLVEIYLKEEKNNAARKIAEQELFGVGEVVGKLSPTRNTTRLQNPETYTILAEAIIDYAKVKTKSTDFDFTTSYNQGAVKKIIGLFVQAKTVGLANVALGELNKIAYGLEISRLLTNKPNAMGFGNMNPYSTWDVSTAFLVRETRARLETIVNREASNYTQVDIRLLDQSVYSDLLVKIQNLGLVQGPSSAEVTLKIAQKLNDEVESLVNSRTKPSKREVERVKTIAKELRETAKTIAKSLKKFDDQDYSSHFEVTDLRLAQSRSTMKDPTDWPTRSVETVEVSSAKKDLESARGEIQALLALIKP